jgi:hypothetical protein
LVIKATASNVTGTGAMTVVNPVVVVDNKTVQVAQAVLVGVLVKDGNEFDAHVARGVALQIHQIDNTKITATWVGQAVTDSAGGAVLSVTGVAVTSPTTNLVIKATVSGVTGTGIITVTP